MLRDILKMFPKTQIPTWRNFIMKKYAVLLLTVAMTAGLLSGCTNKAGTNGNQNGTTNSATENNAAGSETGNDADMQNAGTGWNYKMGLGVVSRMKRANNAGSTDGSAEVETIIAAVSLDAEDRIMDCRIDMVEHVIPVSNTGAIGTQAQTEYRTKRELGDAYGMGNVSGIGKEWYEQVDAFEQYVVGKTIHEINGISTDEAGYVQDENLNTSVTISISDFQAAIAKAVENAR